MGMISTAQLRMIYGLARKAGLDNDMLHTLVQGQTNLGSLKQLNSYQGKLVIDRLQGMSGVTLRDVAGRASTAQQKKIYALARELGWAEEPKRLRRFLEARFGCADVRFLPEERVGSVIEALKAMAAGGRGERVKEAVQESDGQ